MRSSGIFLSILLMTFLTGCAISNEGAVDLRRTDQSYPATLDPKPSLPKNNYQLLQYKNISLGKDKKFIRGDSLSLHLRSAYLKTFSENHVLPLVTQAFTRQWGKSKGEIAIVANAFEMLNNAELDQTNQRDGRVVFYSGDVNPGQFLNFNNMPIYGPITYQGAPLAFRITIFELDVISKQAKVMLKTVSDFGAQSFAPASPVLSILNGIGDSLLTGDQTDTEFRYSMVLSPTEGVDTLSHFALETGNYVLIRSEDRSKTIDWNDLILNENEGRLYHKNHNLYTESTYLVFEVNKNVSAVDVDLQQNKFSSLISTLEQQDQAKATALGSFKQSLSAIAKQRGQIVNFDKAKQLITAIENRDNTKNSQIDSRLDAETVLKIVAGSVDINGNIKTEDSTLNTDQVNYIMRKLSKLPTAIAQESLTEITTVNIAKAFSNDPQKTTTLTKILDLIAPLKPQAITP